MGHRLQFEKLDLVIVLKAEAKEVAGIKMLPATSLFCLKVGKAV